MRSAICFLFLLAATSVFGSTSGKWSLELHHGCKVWDDQRFDEQINREYKLWWSGTCSQGYASGEGYLQWEFPDKRYPDTPPLVVAQYDGTIVKGKLQGKGKLSLSSSYTYTGDFVDGQPEGQGVESWPTGEHFTGRYANGYRNGWGTYYFDDGNALSGEWKNDSIVDGFETFEWAGSKDRYEGNMVHGLPSGHGFLIDSTGKHEGEWADGVLTIGTETYRVFPIKKGEKPSKPSP